VTSDDAKQRRQQPDRPHPTESIEVADADAIGHFRVGGGRRRSAHINTYASANDRSYATQGKG
jgi:hypothetical protein